MNIKTLFLIAKKRIKKIIYNPNIYVAAVVGVAAGLGMGGAVGAFAGGFIGYTLKLCTVCMANPWGIDPNIILGAGIGFVAGAVVGGGVTGLITIYKIYNKSPKLPVLSRTNIPEVLWSSLRVGVEVAIGMGLGAIIGSLKMPGYGTIAGAVIGVLLMLLTTSLERKPKK